MSEYHKYRLKEIPRACFENMISNYVSDDLLRYLLLELDDCFIPFFHGTDRHILRLTSQERDEAKNYCVSAVKFLKKKYDENNWEDYSKTNGLNSRHEKYHKVVDPCSQDKRHNKTGTHIIMHSCFFYFFLM